MPIGYSSPARNFFLLGSSGGDTITNFFRGVDKSADTIFNSFSTSDIQYNGATGSVQEYGISGWKHDSTSAAQAKEHGWIENRTLNLETLATSTIFDATISSTIQSDARVNDILFANGFIYACGFADDNDFIAKYDESSGQIVGFSTSTLGNNRHFKLAVDANGEIYACGYIETTQNQITVVKYDANLNPVWSKLMDAYGQAALKSIAVAKDGNIVCAGYIGDQAHHDDSDKIKGYVVKVSSFTGEILWDRTIEDNIGKGEYDFPCNIIIEDLTFNDSGEMFIVGYKSRYSTNVESKDSGFIIKYDDVGNILWQSTSNYDNVALHSSLHYYRVKTDSDTGQTITLGRLINFDNFAGQNNAAVLLSKYSSSGELLWRREIDSGASNELYDGISLDADSTFYYVAFTDTSESLTNSRPDRYVFGKVSTSGNGLGAFQYADQEGVNLDYVYNGYSDVLGRLSDGSVRNDTSDLITYPFNANKIVFDDLATHITNKKAQINTAGNFLKSDFVEIRPADFQELNLLGDVYSGSGDWLDQSGKGNNAVTSFTTSAEEPFSGAGSIEFDGNDYLEIADNSVWDQPGDFTIEYWVYFNDVSGSIVPVGRDGGYITLQSVNGRVRIVRYAQAILTETSFYPSVNTWYHFALVRSGSGTNNLKAYVDGVEVGQSTETTSTQPANPLNIGRNGSTYTDYLNGYLSNVRILNGTALYTSNFTPPTSALTNTGQTTSSSNYSTIYSSMLTSPGLKTVTAGFTEPHSNSGTNPIRSEGTGGLLFTPTTAISYSSQVEVLDNNNVTACWFNQTNNSGSSTQHINGWVTVASGSGTINTMYFERTDNSGWDAGFCAIRVDGTILADTVWSPDDAIASNKPPSQLFDGNTGTRVETVTAGGTVRWTPDTTISWSSSLRINTGAYSGSITVRANGTTTVIHANGTQVQSPYWTSHPNSSGTIEYIEAQGHIGAGTGYMTAIEVDGTILVNGSGGTTGTVLLTAQGASITDASDSNHSITVNGDAAASVGGTIGPTHTDDGYWDFDGTPGLGDGDTINLGDTSTYNWIHDRSVSNWAIEGWFWNDRDEEYGALISNNSGTGAVGFYMGQRNDSQFECVINKGTAGTPACRVLSTNILDHNRWYHIVFVNENYTIKMYVDGVLQSNGGDQNSFATGSTANAQTDLRIGKLGTSPAWNLDGRIGEVRIYKDRSLTAAQVFQNYNANRYKYDGIAANTSVLTGPGILYDDLIMNFDFGNDYTIERLGTIQG